MVFVLKQLRSDTVKLLKRGASTGNSPVHGDVLKTAERPKSRLL